MNSSSTIPSTVKNRCVQLLRFFLILWATTCIACQRSAPLPVVESTDFLMDTLVWIKVFDPDQSTDQIAAAISAARHEMQRIDSLTNLYSGSSSVSMVNLSAGKKTMEVDAAVIDILKLSLSIYQLSDGAFDPTIAPVKKLWGFGWQDSLRVPEAAALLAACKSVNASAVVVDSPRIFLTIPGAALDLSGVSKGYAVDRAIAVLAGQGIRDAMVDAGGDLRTLASGYTSGKRNVYIRHPRDSDKFWGRFPLDTGAVATSGDYERYFDQDSLRYHHILDPATGYPARGCVSVTVCSPSCALSDALSTAVFVMGPQKGLELLENLSQAEGLIIYQEEGVLREVMTKGMAAGYVPLH